MSELDGFILDGFIAVSRRLGCAVSLALAQRSGLWSSVLLFFSTAAFAIRWPLTF